MIKTLKTLKNKIYLLILLSFSALSAHAEAWDSAAQQVLNILTGPLARTCAIIALAAVGLMAMTGRINWRWAGSIIAGLVLIFGGATFVDMVISAAGG